MRFTILKLSLMALVAVALVVSAAPANATTISFTSGSTTASVTYTFGGGSLSITSISLNGDTSGKLFTVGIDSGSITGAPADFTQSKTNQNCDGIGTCSSQVTNPGGSTPFPVGSFTISGTPTTLFFHLGGFSSQPNCSIWLKGPVGGGTATDESFVASDCGGTPPPSVPEPGSLTLLGTGLVGLAGLVRRRFLS